jgi:hypothetical protein
MTERGRKPGFTMSHEHRLKIQKSNIVRALIQHAEGKREMTATQVQAGLGLLKKCLPDLQAIELTGADGGPIETLNVTDVERAKALAVFLAKTMPKKD